VSEIEEARLREGEDVQLEEEARRLEHAEELRTLAEGMAALLDGEEDAVLQRLAAVQRSLGAIQRIDPSLARLQELYDSGFYALEELSRELVEYERSVDLDPERLGYHLQALVSIRITPGARSQLQAFADQLRALPEVTQFFYLAGASDFIVHFQARTTEDLRDFVTEQLSTNPIVAATNTSLIFEHDVGAVRL
jgi:hypothetical protein